MLWFVVEGGENAAANGINDDAAATIAVETIMFLFILSVVVV